MRTLAKIVGVLVLLFAAYIAYWFYQDHRARTQSSAFCDSVAVGSDMAAVESAASAAKVARHGYMQSEGVYLAIFPGPIFNAYTCELKMAGGKVAAKRVVEPKD
jgi:hypothetical protein